MIFYLGNIQLFLFKFRPVWSPAIYVPLNDGYKLFSIPPPGSGVILAYILNILKHYNIQPSDENPLLYHRIVEAYKWAYAQRTLLGDPFDENITDDVINVSSINSFAFSHRLIDLFYRLCLI